jgi:regulator of cell morphogenesis and NO signaling
MSSHSPLTVLEAPEATDWSQRSLEDLIEHIESVHHAYLRRELPRLRNLFASIDRAICEHPQFGDLGGLLDALDAELTQHMRKEEMVLFPWIVETERRQTGKSRGCSSLVHPIAVMEHEHRDATEALDRMRWLTGYYRCEPGLDSSLLALLEGLAALDDDLRRHIREENDVLFPRALQLEKGSAAQSRAWPSQV